MEHMSHDVWTCVDPQGVVKPSLFAVFFPFVKASEVRKRFETPSAINQNSQGLVF